MKKHLPSIYANQRDRPVAQTSTSSTRFHGCFRQPLTFNDNFHKVDALSHLASESDTPSVPHVKSVQTTEARNHPHFFSVIILHVFGVDPQNSAKICEIHRERARREKTCRPKKCHTFARFRIFPKKGKKKGQH